MPRIDIDGAAIEYERRGSGPPVVLVHGLGGPATWVRVVPLLAESCDVLLPHLPGFGESPPARAPLAAPDHARLIARLLALLDIRGAVLAGISYGGEIAAAIAAAGAGSGDAPGGLSRHASGDAPGDMSRHASGAASSGASDTAFAAGRVKHLVLVCPTGTLTYPRFVRSRTARAIARPLLRAALTNRLIADFLSRRSFHDPSARPPGHLESYLGMLRRPGRAESLITAIGDIRSRGGELPGLVRRSGVSVTLVWGAEDRTVPPSHAEVLRSVRPDAVVQILPGCGHSVPLERPRELAGILAAAAARRPA